MQQYGKRYSSKDKHVWESIFGDVLGDLWFVNPSVEMALKHSDNGCPTYMYKMTHQTKLFHFDEYSGKGRVRRPEHCTTDHGDEIIYTFGTPLASKLLNDDKFSDEEKIIAKCWMRYLANFARTGDPNSGNGLPRQWPTFEKGSKRFLELKYPFAIGQDIHDEKLEFWRTLFI